MTPENETPSDEPGASRFRERRSAHVGKESEERAPSPAEPPEMKEEAVEADAPTEEVPPPEAEGAQETVVGPEGDAPGPEPGPSEAGEADLDRLEQMEIPEASFLELVQPLEIQALQFLGVVPISEEGEKRIMPKWAKHVIDLLGILEDRTRGNLTDEESEYLETVLHELRMRYLKVSS